MSAPAATTTPTEVKKTVVAIAAASGWLGSNLARGFVAHPSYTTRLLANDLKDKDGKDKFEGLKAQGATVVQVDYKNVDSLAKNLEGVDIVVSAVGGNGLLDSQLALIDASVKAKVRRFVPSEFGFDPRKTGAPEPIFSLKHKVLEKLFASGLEWTVISTAFFGEIITGPWPGIIDVKHKKVNIPGSEDTLVTTIGLDDIGKLTPDVLLHPASKNAYATLYGETISYGQLAKQLEELTGEKWTRVITPEKDLQAKIDGNPNKWATLPEFFGLVQAQGKGILDEKDSFNRQYFPEYHLVKPLHLALAALTAPVKKQHVAIAGATGVIGHPIAQGFLAHSHYKVTILRHEEKDDPKAAAKAKLYDEFKKKGATIINVDYKNQDSLNAALAGVDIVVSTVGGAALVDGQLNLLTAAIKNGVRRFVPSEFGSDMKKTGYTEPLFSLKKPIVDALEKAAAEGKIEYTLVVTGFFTEFFLGPYAHVIDLHKKHINVPGGEDVKITHTSVHDIGTLLPLALLRPESKNTTIYLLGETVSYKQLGEILHHLSGHKFHANITPEKELQAQFDSNPNKWAVIMQFFQLLQTKGLAALDETTSFNAKYTPHVKTLKARDFLHHQVRTHKG